MRAAALLLALGWLWAGCARSPYVEALPAEAVAYRARTEDGWSLSLRRYTPAAAKGRPVLLIHGISANDRNMDLDARHSIARWFAAQGRDAWTVSLRGTGASDRVSASAGRPGGYAFDAYWRYDLPAAIARIRAETGAETIDCVAHSMGGMVLYAYLSQGGQGIGAAAVLGSPTRLDWGNPYAPYLTRLAAQVGPDWVLPAGTPPLFVVPVSNVLEGGPFEHLLYNAENTTRESMRKLLAMATDDMAGGVARQLSRLISDGVFASEDGTRDFRRDLATVHTPVLVVAGKLDRIGVPPAVRDGYRLLGGPKEWLLMAEENGAMADYGHMDLVIGERAPVELWPRLLDFLDRHADAAAGSR